MEKSEELTQEEILAAREAQGPMGKDPEDLEILANTSLTFSANRQIEKPPFECETCGEQQPYQCRQLYKRWTYRRSECKCERDQIAREAQERLDAERRRAEYERRCAIRRCQKSCRLVGKYRRYTFRSLEQHPRFHEAMQDGLEEAYSFCKGYASGWPQKRGIVLCAPQNGSFKTGLVCSVARELLKIPVEVEFWFTTDLLNAIRSTYSYYHEDHDSGPESHVGIVERLSSQLPLLILDDLGGERIATDERGDWAREQLFQIIYWRDVHELPVLVTTNCTIDELEESLYGRTISRLMGMCDWINIDLEEDYRLKSQVSQEASPMPEPQTVIPRSGVGEDEAFGSSNSIGTKAELNPREQVIRDTMRAYGCGREEAEEIIDENSYQASSVSETIAYIMDDHDCDQKKAEEIYARRIAQYRQASAPVPDPKKEAAIARIMIVHNCQTRAEAEELYARGA
jgi:DNA replication protein DnaC